MRVRISQSVMEKVKKQDVRIRNSFKERMRTFSKNPTDPILDNHPLGRELTGYRSIDITADYRAVFEELHEGEEYSILFLSFWCA